MSKTEQTEKKEEVSFEGALGMAQKYVRLGEKRIARVISVNTKNSSHGYSSTIVFQDLLSGEKITENFRENLSLQDGEDVILNCGQGAEYAKKNDISYVENIIREGDQWNDGDVPMGELTFEAFKQAITDQYNGKKVNKTVDKTTQEVEENCKAS